MRIYKEFFFEAAHFLPSAPAGHPNARVHGHSFRVRVSIEKGRLALRVAYANRARKPERLSFEVSSVVHDGVCAVPVYVQVESLDYELAEIFLEPVPGFFRSRTCQGLVIADGCRPVGAGLLLGAFGAWALGRSLESFLFGVSAVDPLSYAAAVALLVAAAAAAMLVPARRAARVTPVIALTDVQ